MTALPTGTVTFLFTDIQGSTKLWQSHPREMRAALRRHDAILRQAIESNNGRVFKTVGDAFCAAFDTAMDGLDAALAAQLRLKDETWDLPYPILIRAALHTGEAEERDSDYFGPALNRVARLLSIGHGGQILLSLVAAELVRDTLPEGVTLRDMGERRLKDLFRPESVYQVLHPGLASEFPPLNSLDLHHHNLPIQPTPLIGREKELEGLTKMLLDPQVRILTLTGPGGMGKTRLALQAAAELIECFRDGSYFVDLAPVRDPGMMMAALAETLHVKESGTRALAEQLKEFLRGMTMLLILDNFEQILEAALRVMEILSACAGVKFLVTSREPLHLRGEKVFSVPPLSLPKRVPRQKAELAAVTQYEAVRLFIERAMAVRPEFQVSNENAPAVAEICIRLDGIPLAIELAAARIRLLSPSGILDRLDRSLKLLTGGARDLPDRQRTLRAAIAWSYDLLDERCRELYRALSVFPGGFTLEAAAAVAGKPSREVNLLDGLESLVEKSLLVSEDPRFRMLETIREYGRERLEESGGLKEALERHARCYLALAEEAGPRLQGRDQAQWLLRIDADRPNLQAALAWCERFDARCFARLCALLWMYWRIRGLLSEGREALARALEKCGDPGDELRPRILLGSGVLSRLQGDFPISLKLLSESREACERRGDRSGAAAASLELGWTHIAGGDVDEARSIFLSARDLALASSDPLDLNLALNGLGCVELAEGNLARAKEHFGACLRGFQENGIPRLESSVACNLGIIHFQEHELEKARERFQRAMELQEALGDLDNLRFTYNNMGSLLQALGDHSGALEYFGKLRDLAQSIHDGRMMSAAYVGMADALLAQQDSERALDFAMKALQEAQSCGDRVERGASCRALGDIMLARGDRAGAKGYFERSIEFLRETREEEDLNRAREGLREVNGCGL